VKTKLTVYVDAPLVKALRIAAADAGTTQGDLVEAALRAALMATKATPSTVALDLLQRGPGAALDVARDLRRADTPHAEIAAELNRRGYRTARGKRWNAVSVSRLLRIT